jgi:hypothetical protein
MYLWSQKLIETLKGSSRRGCNSFLKFQTLELVRSIYNFTSSQGNLPERKEEIGPFPLRLRKR